MVLQAFVDDSYNPNGSFVLAGHIGTAETWAKFARDWEALLPHGVMAPGGGYHFKMAEMAQTPERMERAEWFFRIVESYDLIPISFVIEYADLQRAVDRIWSPNSYFLDREKAKAPFRYAFRGLMDMFHSNRPTLSAELGSDEPVNFIFDEQSEKTQILSTWNEYISKRPTEIRHLFGATPRFENDRRFLPLQAADMWAWLIRSWHENGCPDDPDLILGRWKRLSSKKRRVHYVFSQNEDNITENILDGLRSSYPNVVVYDSKFSRQWP